MPRKFLLQFAMTSGLLLALPSLVHAREEMKVTAFGMLERSNTTLVKGRAYLLTFKGTFSLWQNGCKEDGAARGLDAFFCYLPLGNCKPPQLSKALVLGSGPWIKSLPDIAMGNGIHMTYSKDHVYRLKIMGTGDSLRASIQDTPSNDNCGALTITIEELKK